MSVLLPHPKTRAVFQPSTIHTHCSLSPQIMGQSMWYTLQWSWRSAAVDDDDSNTLKTS